MFLISKYYITLAFGFLSACVYEYRVLYTNMNQVKLCLIVLQRLALKLQVH